MKKKKIIILGAGPTGLVLARELAKNHDVTVIEKEKFAGGLSSSFTHKGMVLDFGPHKFYTQLDGINEYYKEVMQKDSLEVKKRNSVRLFGKYFSFPISPKQMIKNVTPSLIWEGTKIGLSYIAGIPRSIFLKPKNYEEYMIKGFGKKGYEALLKDIAVKLWGEPSGLSVDIARKRVPVSGIPQIIKMILTKKKDKNVSADTFHYPKKGFVQFMDNMRRDAEKRKAEFIFGTGVKSIDLSKGKVKVVAGDKTVEADLLISTIPLKTIIHGLKESPKDVIDSVDRLRYNDLLICYMIIDKEKVLDDNWIFFMQKDTIINRMAELKSFSKHIFPKNKTVLTAEISHDKDGLLAKDDNAIKKILFDEIEKTGLLSRNDISEVVIKRFKNVYPVYSIGYKENLSKTLNYLDSFDQFYTVGRAGLFNYNNVDHCIDMSIRLAKHINDLKEKREWTSQYAYFDTYRIVD